MYLIDMFCLGGYLGFHERAKELSVGGVGGATQLSPEHKAIICHVILMDNRKKIHKGIKNLYLQTHG